MYDEVPYEEREVHQAMSISVSKLRENIYQILDEVLETGRPLEIARKGRKLKISPVKGEGKLKNLEKHDCLNSPPDDIVHMDWSGEWKV
jgi:antitoxin (DNA-binding transcriptional repressor) of toxin-antitoxin stability system